MLQVQRDGSTGEKPDDLNAISGVHIVEENRLQKLPSDFHTSTTVHVQQATYMHNKEMQDYFQTVLITNCHPYTTQHIANGSSARPAEETTLKNARNYVTSRKSGQNCSGGTEVPGVS